MLIFFMRIAFNTSKAMAMEQFIHTNMQEMNQAAIVALNNGLMATALNGTDPVICMESQPLYDMGEEFHLEGVPTEPF